MDFKRDLELTITNAFNTTELLNATKTQIPKFLMGHQLNIERTYDEFKKETLETIKIVLNKQIPEDFPFEFYADIMLRNINAMAFRDVFIMLQGFALISKNWIRELAKYLKDKKTLEIMSGTGCLAYALQEEGINIIATDNFSWRVNKWEQNDRYYCDIEDIDCVAAIEKYGKETDVIICSWPYMDSNIWRCLIKMREVNPKCTMVYIGEGPGGCTADDAFFDDAKFIKDEDITNADACFRSWDMVHDRICLVK